MQTTATKTVVPAFFTYSLVSLLIVALVLYVGMGWWRACRTMPNVEGYSYLSTLTKQLTPDKTGPALPAGVESSATATTETLMKEGFYAGPARGAGTPDCLRTSSEAAELHDMISSRCSSTEEGPDDLRELTVLLSKLTCFKRDLMGTAKVVEATRYQPFSTSHDLEPVAETTARCFAKTIPQRDLSLSLDKWGRRGTFLIKRLCTSYGFSDAEEGEALTLFGKVMADVGDVAMGACCDAGTPVLAGQNAPRMVTGYEPPGDYEMREYKGYY